MLIKIFVTNFSDGYRVGYLEIGRDLNVLVKQFTKKYHDYLGKPFVKRLTNLSIKEPKPKRS